MSEDLDEIIEKLKRNGSTFNSDVLKQIKEEVIKSLKKRWIYFWNFNRTNKRVRRKDKLIYQSYK